ncbi:MAG: ATP-binding protein, partial [Phenylobacterium sp.]
IGAGKTTLLLQLMRSLGPAIQLTTDFPPEIVPVLGDANQLETVLLNLAVNARDAMPAGGRLHIEARAETVGADASAGLPAGDYICLSVTDDGVGMDEATLARATEPFYTTKGVGKGTGLGLSMAHGLAEQSGGRLTLASRPGEGTRVEIWLPRAKTRGSRAAGPARTDDAIDWAGRPLTVLAVDDDFLVLTNTAAMLEDLGHQVIAASSAAEALQAMGERQVDVVITDHAMPQMTGLQLAREIAAAWPDLPVILATGYAELPADAGDEIPRLAKPYGQAALARILREVRPAPAAEATARTAAPRTVKTP